MPSKVRNNSPPVRHVVGVMTGTSIDGIDAALVRIHGTGLDLRAELVRHVSRPLDDLRLRLRAAAEQTPMTAGDFAKLAWDFGSLHTAIIRELIEGQPIDLICAHGQTVFHQPPVSWQLLNPAPIATAFKCPVVFDLRQADLAAGGQGAPITPIADWILFRDEKKTRAIVNLGGFCNVTILPKRASFKRAGASSPPSVNAELEQIRGLDVCACNQILDAIARAALSLPFDEDGRTAASGASNDLAAQTLRDLIVQQASRRRSLGTGDEILHWVKKHQHELAPADLAATAVHAIGVYIAQTLKDHQVDEAILAGGGARNQTLVKTIARAFGKPVMLSGDLGVPIEAREAMCFAILGALCEDRVPITLRQVTGCAIAPLSGVWCAPQPQMSAQQ